MYSIHGEKGIKPLQIIQRYLISVKIYRRSVGESAEYIHKCLLKVVPCEDRQTKYLFFHREWNLRKIHQKFITTKFLLTNHIILTHINTFVLFVHMKVAKQETLLHYISLYKKNTQGFVDDNVTCFFFPYK